MNEIYLCVSVSFSSTDGAKIGHHAWHEMAHTLVTPHTCQRATLVPRPMLPLELGMHSNVFKK
jgi:hypothetical protein